MIGLSELSDIGVINKPHGIKGEISVSFDSEDAKNAVLAAGHIFVEIDGLIVPFGIKSSRPKGAESMLLSLKGIDDEQMAGSLSQNSIYIEKSYLSDSETSDEGFYLEDLIGYSVYDGDIYIGKASGYDDTTENVLLIVSDDSGREILIPADNDFINDIDIEKSKIEMTLPSGLTDL